MSYARLGEEIGLSSHGAADRVRRLQRLGAIRGFTAIVDPGSMGRAVEAFVDIRLVPSTDPDAFEQRARALPTVEELAFVTGRFDYQARLACADTEELDRTVRHLRQSGGVAHTETRIVMRSSYRRDPLP
jgi:Lrp/AsnC family leucine-responsive transcriptional regulator